MEIVSHPGNRPRGELDSPRRRHLRRPVEDEHEGEAGVVVDPSERLNRRALQRPEGVAGGEQIEALRHRAGEDEAAGTEHPGRLPCLDLERHCQATIDESHRRGLHAGADLDEVWRERRGEPFGEIGHAERAAPACVAVTSRLDRPLGVGQAREAIAPGADHTGGVGIGHRRPERARADGEELSAVVADSRTDASRRHPPANPARLLQDDRPAAGLGQLRGGGQPTDPGADHDRIDSVVGGAAHRVTAGAGAGRGKSIPSGSFVEGTLVEARSSPAPQPAIAPITSAAARTRVSTWVFSGGNWER